MGQSYLVKNAVSGCRWLGAARLRPYMPLFGMWGIFLGLICLVFVASSLAVPLSAYAGKGGVKGSNHSGGNKGGNGNGNGNGGGNGGGHGNGGGNGGGNSNNPGLGNAYGGGNMGDIGATGKGRDIKSPDELREAAQPDPNSHRAVEFNNKWDAATQVDLEVELNLDDLERLNTITNNAVGYLGKMVLPSSANSTDTTSSTSTTSAPSSTTKTLHSKTKDSSDETADSLSATENSSAVTAKTPPGLVDKSTADTTTKTPPGLVKKSSAETTAKTPPGLVGKSPPGLVDKSPPGLTGVKLNSSSNGKALGVLKKEIGDVLTGDAQSPVTKKNTPPPPANKTKIKPGTYSPREVLAVNLTPEGASRLRSQGFSVRQPSPYRGGQGVSVISTPRQMDALSAMRRLRRELPGEQFHLNRYYQLYRPARQDNVLPQWPRQARIGHVVQCREDQCYGRQTIHWKAGFAGCAKGIRIGVIDTDVDLRHPTFSGQRITHMNFLPEGRRASSNWHGTGVLALLAGRPDSGTPGLIHEAEFFVASIFFVGDNDNVQTDTVSLVQALDWMRASKVQLINMSFSGPEDGLVHSRISELRESGVVFIAAAGNNGPTSPPAYPAAYPQVIAVTAVDRERQVFPLAVQGPHIDIAAPGVRIWTAVPKAREGYRSGTSFAVPFATAVLALQSPKTWGTPKDTQLDHLKFVHLSKNKGRDTVFGRGLIQAPAACSKSVSSFAHKGVALPSRQ